jgi:putative PIN family toxin of toxin-antitoxin system
LRVVLDTNTIVSAIGWNGAPRRVLLALHEGEHQLATTTALLDELMRVLAYPKLRSIAAHPALPVILEWLYRPEHLVVPQERIRLIGDDLADNAVLEAAVAAGADAIVSGDRHLLRLRAFRGIPVLTARDFAGRHLRSIP